MLTDLPLDTRLVGVEAEFKHSGPRVCVLTPWTLLPPRPSITLHPPPGEAIILTVTGNTERC